MRCDEIDDYFRQMIAAGNFLAFRDMRDNNLRRITRIHLKQRILHSCLVLYVVERIRDLTYIMVQRARTNEKRIRSDSLCCFCCEIRYLHRMLESTRSAFCECMKEFRVNIRQFNQRDRRDKTEEFLKHINQAIATDCQ